jgi:hypothetical protein
MKKNSVKVTYIVREDVREKIHELKDLGVAPSQTQVVEQAIREYYDTWMATRVPHSLHQVVITRETHCQACKQPIPAGQPALCGLSEGLTRVIYFHPECAPVPGEGEIA